MMSEPQSFEDDDRLSEEDKWFLRIIDDLPYKDRATAKYASGAVVKTCEIQGKEADALYHYLAEISLK